MIQRSALEGAQQGLLMPPCQGFTCHLQRILEMDFSPSSQAAAVIRICTDAELAQFHLPWSMPLTSTRRKIFDRVKYNLYLFLMLLIFRNAFNKLCIPVYNFVHVQLWVLYIAQAVWVSSPIHAFHMMRSLLLRSCPSLLRCLMLLALLTPAAGLAREVSLIMTLASVCDYLGIC